VRFAASQRGESEFRQSALEIVLVVSTQREVVQQIDRVSPVAWMDAVEVLAVSLDEGLKVSLQGGELGVNSLGGRYAIVGPRWDAPMRGTRVAHRKVRTNESCAPADRTQRSELKSVPRRARRLEHSYF
jgi:hypothetical protein